jgi:hypothetical protein
MPCDSLHSWIHKTVLKIMKFRAEKLLVWLSLGIACGSAQTQTNISVLQGWNLLGNGAGSPITVSSALNNKDAVNTVWVWSASDQKWGFYTPTIADGGAAYASTKSYTPLSTIPVNQGFWVNALQPFTVSLTSSGTGSISTSAATSSTAGATTTTKVSTTTTVTGATTTTVASTTTTTAASTTSSTVSFATPATFSTLLTSTYTGTKTLTTASSFSTRSRYLISDSAATSSTANYLSIADDYSATTGFSVSTTNISSTATLKNYLASTIQVVASGDGNFRLDSHLHPNNAIDYVSSTSKVLQFKDNFGLVTEANKNGYITFAYSGGKLQAKNRYTYSLTSTTSTSSPNTSYSATYTQDTTFSAANYYVKLSNGVYSLVADSASATSFYLYSSPIDFGHPTSMNPGAVAYVTNKAAPFMSKLTVAATEGTSGSVYKQRMSKYQPQVANPGTNAATKASADAMLQTVDAALKAEGSSLRYSTALYSAYRDATLAGTLASNAIADGTPGQHLVPYVFFTNEQDSSGKYHPYMVIVSYGNSGGPHNMIDTPRPPGANDGNGYANSSVTRYANLDNYVLAIPMKDYGLVSAVTDNTLTKTLLSDMGSTYTAAADVYNYASIADNGILIDGSVMFPVMNNTLGPSQYAAELSINGCHVGQGGGGPHCHADGYQSGAGVGIGVYNDLDYYNVTHPPVIGFGYDGVALFARYRPTSDASKLGYSTALDDFGGHNHDGIGYHYHAHTVADYSYTATNSPTIKSTLQVLMKGAWKGKIGSLPFFAYNNTSPGKPNKYIGEQ